jgi:hypothetical protein
MLLSNQIIVCPKGELERYIPLRLTIPPHQTITLYRKGNITLFYKTGEFFNPNPSIWEHIIITTINRDLNEINVLEVIAEPYSPSGIEVCDYDC